MLGWASQRIQSIPICRGWFLFCGLSATSGVGGGQDGDQGREAALRRRHLPAGAVGMAEKSRPGTPPPPPRPPQHQALHKTRLSITLQVSDASSLAHGVHAFSTGQKCQHIMKGLIHGGWQRRRSWSSSRYDPDWCWWASLKMGAIIKCPCAITKFLSCS